jgi:DNA-directed RNA polymerase subunit RPC12/RpoP
MRILRRQKSAYALALTMCFIGLAALFIPLWEMWPQIFSAEDPFSAFWSLLWRESLNLIPGFDFKLAYFFILGVVMIISGVVIWVLSRQWFYLPGKTVLFQCPFCKKQWRSLSDKALVHCPHCRQLVHPKIVEKQPYK